MPLARISGLWCATSRFSSAVMPWNSRMFWKVRATRALRAISWSGMRSSRKSSPFAVVAWRPLARVAAAMSSGVATPSRANASRPSVGL